MSTCSFLDRQRRKKVALPTLGTRLCYPAPLSVHISLESNLKDEDSIGNAITILLLLTPPLPSKDYESMALEYSIEHSYNITMIKKTSKLVSSLTLTLLILEREEILVLKCIPTLSDYYWP